MLTKCQTFSPLSKYWCNRAQDGRGRLRVQLSDCPLLPSVYISTRLSFSLKECPVFFNLHPFAVLKRSCAGTCCKRLSLMTGFVDTFSSPSPCSTHYYPYLVVHVCIVGGIAVVGLPRWKTCAWQNFDHFTPQFFLSVTMVSSFTFQYQNTSFVHCQNLINYHRLVNLILRSSFYFCHLHFGINSFVDRPLCNMRPGTCI